MDGEEHEHGFERGSSERATATVRWARGGSATVESAIEEMTVLKTTGSGFTDYLQDRYTLLPPTEERCLATELSASWRFVPSAGAPAVDYAATRTAVRKQLSKGIFGPAVGGIYSPSLQATIYDAGCMVLQAAPTVQSISISEPPPPS